jgi:hypothetical protein
MADRLPTGQAGQPEDLAQGFLSVLRNTFMTGTRPPRRRRPPPGMNPAIPVQAMHRNEPWPRPPFAMAGRSLWIEVGRSFLLNGVGHAESGVGRVLVFPDPDDRPAGLGEQPIRLGVSLAVA